MSPVAGDVVIVGGGIVGAACAAACAREDLSVVLIESDGVASGATGAGTGHIVVVDESELELALTQYSQRLWNELAPSLPPEVEFDPCGTIWVAADEEEMREVDRKRVLFQARGVDADVLDSTGLARVEPNLRPGLPGALSVPGDAIVNPTSAAQFLLRSAEDRGTRVLLGHRAVKLTSRGVTMEDGSMVESPAVIVAAGVGSPQLVPGFDVRPRKGHVVMTEGQPGFVAHQVVEVGYPRSARASVSESLAFSIQPRRGGRFLIGSSRQNGVLPKEADPGIVNRILERAHRYFPRLVELPIVRVWTGFRPASADGLPLIGPVSADNHVYLATGHEGLGVTASLATAQLLVDQMIGRPTAIPAAPYWPNRGRTIPASGPSGQAAATTAIEDVRGA